MPSSSLLGLETPCGWKVTKELKHKMVSGGCHSCRYEAEKDGQVAFLKAMDLKSALDPRNGDTLTALNRLSSEYLFEREILNHCKDLSLTRVVTPLDAGEMIVPNQPDLLSTVYYVVFEKADNDLRQQHLDASEQDWFFAFKALHHVTLGVGQLHRAGIAHQDIKPSNILCFNEAGSKISDLGRVTDKDNKSPFHGFSFTGDPRYIPPEFQHNYRVHEFSERYYSDVFMVGSLTFQMITGVNMTQMLRAEAQAIQPQVCSLLWADALPIYLSAFNSILIRFHNECTSLFNEKIANNLRTLVFEMCHPDPAKRGSPRRSHLIGKLSMDRYTGILSTVIRLLKTEKLENVE